MSKSKKGSSARAKSRGAPTSPQRRRVARSRAGRPPTGAVSLAAECLIDDAPALKLTLAARLEASSTVVLDVSAVRRIDSASLQLIGAFVRARTSRGLGISWQGAAPAFTTAAHLLGLAELLQIPAPAPDGAVK